MEIINTFPEQFRNNRRRQAELAVYEALADSDVEGIAVYGAVPSGGCEVDFAVWYVGHVRAAIEVKGGEYENAGGVWQRVPDLGGEPVTGQIAQAFRSGIGMHRYLKQHEGDHSPYVVSVLVLPDIPPGHEIERTNGKAIVLCGLERLVERIRKASVGRHDIHFPPTWDVAGRESELLLTQPSETEPEPQPPV